MKKKFHCTCSQLNFPKLFKTSLKHQLNHNLTIKVNCFISNLIKTGTSTRKTKPESLSSSEINRKLKLYHLAAENILTLDCNIMYILILHNMHIFEA